MHTYTCTRKYITFIHACKIHIHSYIGQPTSIQVCACAPTYVTCIFSETHARLSAMQMQCTHARTQHMQSSVHPSFHPSMHPSYILACMHTYMHACKHDIHTCICEYIHTYIHPCMHACMHRYIHTCRHKANKSMHTRTHTNLQLHTQRTIRQTYVLYIQYTVITKQTCSHRYTQTDKPVKAKSTVIHAARRDK